VLHFQLSALISFFLTSLALLQISFIYFIGLLDQGQIEDHGIRSPNGDYWIISFLPFDLPSHSSLLQLMLHSRFLTFLESG
jgi:hypothetical protein